MTFFILKIAAVHLRESALSIRTDLSVSFCAVVATTEKTLPIAAVHLRESELSISTDLSVPFCAVVATTKNRQQPDDSCCLFNSKTAGDSTEY